MIKFFLSHSEDLVDPDYDFITDKHPPGRDRWRDDVYAHQILGEPICDGIFLSGVVTSALSRRVRTAGSVQAFLRLPPRFPVMGDCGAFRYKHQDAPPYETRDVLEIYQRYGYTHGASVDHLIDPKSSLSEKRKRWDITLQNAQDFIRGYRDGAFTFVPVGVAQGWDTSSYRQAVEMLLEFGYKYVAIGGITRLSTKRLRPILEEVSAVLPDGVDLHLLGIARLSNLALFQRVGVTSLNGSTPVRQGTMGEYWTPDGGKYGVIRLPYAVGRQSSRRPSDEYQDGTLDEKKVSETDLVSLEQTCLSLLRDYERDEVSLEQVLEAVLRYNRLKGDRKDHRDEYRRLLHDRPWKSCPCEICQNIGIQAVIMRGNDRNRRRGFHNCWVFYRRFRAVLAADS